MNPNDVRTLVDQVSDGLRSAIADGWYKPGEAVPPSRDLASILGVSRRVTKTALERLVREGFIISRPRIGSVVRDRAAKQWLGNVLFVQRSSGRTYYVNVFTAALRARLVKAGWLFTQVTVTPNPDGEADMSELGLHLTHPVSLAVVMFDNPPVESALSRAGVPFVTLGNGAARRRGGCVGHVRYNRAGAASELAEAAAAAGVKSATQVGVEGFDDMGAAFRKVGIRSSKWNIPFPSGGKSPEAVSFAVRDAFARWLSEKGAHGNHKRMPDLFYFSDDHACTGALAALSAAGVRVPEDVRIATWSNLGNGPVYAEPLARLEIDPEGDAEKFADALLAHLEDRSGAFPLAFVPTFRKGATL